MQPGNKIREFRENKGLTQADLSQKLGYSQKFISAIETGRAMPSRNFLIKLNEVFGISSDYILYGGPPDQAETGLASHPEGYAEKKEVMIIREPESKYQILPTATKKILDNVMEILESDNEVMADALRANIKAFLEAVRLKKRSDEDKSKGCD